MVISYIININNNKKVKLEKSLWLTALRPNEGKTFALSVWKVLKKPVAQLKLCREIFVVCQKSVKTTKLFFRLAFVVYGVYIMMVLHCNAHYYANISL